LIFLGLSLHLSSLTNTAHPEFGSRSGCRLDTERNQMAAFDKTNRLKLTVQKKPHFITIAPGLALGYRRNDGAGAWVVRKAIGNGNSEIKKFATADDLEKSNGTTILNYEQARVHANAEAKREGRQ